MFPLKKHAQSRKLQTLRLSYLATLVSKKIGSVIHVKSTYFALTEDDVGGGARVKTMAVNMKTLNEMLMFEYLVEPLNDLFRTPLANNVAWVEKTDRINSVMSTMGPLLSEAFGYSMQHLSSDECTERICECIVNHLGVTVDDKLVFLHLAPLLQRCDASELMVGAVCRSSFPAQLLGQRLPCRLRTALHCEAFGTELPEFDVGTNLLDELVETRKALCLAKASASVPHAVREFAQDHQAHDDDCDDSMGSMLADLYVRRRVGQSKLGVTIQVIQHTLNNNVALKNAPSIFSDAFNLFASMGGIDDETLEDALSKLTSRPTLCNNMLHLEEALDHLIKEQINQDFRCNVDFCSCLLRMLLHYQTPVEWQWQQ